MALVNVQNIQFQNNPSPFQSPLSLDITFECLKAIPDEIEWQLIYIGSAKDEQYDQVLDKFSMGQLEQGVMQFTIESNPPDYTKIPSKEDLLGVTAIILTVSYRNQEFFRVGYYVYNQYTDPELIENDPAEVLIEKVERNILANQPRITHFNIKWGNEEEEKITDENQNNLNNLMQDMQQLNNHMQNVLPNPFQKYEVAENNNSSNNNYMFAQGLNIPMSNAFQTLNCMNPF